MNRRGFLATGLRGSTLVSLASSVPGFLSRAARATTPDCDGRILVVIELAGGNDGINTVVPYRDEGYARHRPTLRLPTNRLLKLTSEMGLNSAMRGFARLWEESSLAIVQGVAYPNPSRSHFESQAIWHTGRPGDGPRGTLGWLGQGLDAAAAPADGGASAMAIGDAPLPVALRGRRSVASGLDKLDAFRFADVDSRPTPLMPGEAGDLAAFVRRSTLDAYATADRLATLVPEDRADPSYPESALSSRLRIIARLIQGGLGTRVYYTGQSGYDTHAIQLFKHNNLLGDLAGALLAFHHDLDSKGLADRVLVLAFSEFGRRVAENGGQGTDHGTAGPVFLTGPCVRAGLVGSRPSLLDLDNGDLKWSIDFRRIYATLLRDWLGLPARSALGGDFERLPLVRA